jgi:glycosyltransferase involved in cell wall biosynthesis
MNNPLVSVIIPTYGRPDTLQRAIQSVHNQTYKAIEIIVVDDNSPESEARYQTEQVMQQYRAYPNILYLQHEQNRNGSAARNTGFRASHGDFIMFLDDDDEFLPEKVAKQLQRLQTLDTSWAACYSAFIRKRNNKIVIRSAENREGQLLVEELMRNLFVHAGSNLMVRRAVVEEMNGFDESFERNQDVEFLVRILRKYKLAYVDYVGLIVHMHINTGVKKNFHEITNDFIKKFAGTIEQLPEEDVIRVYRMLYLQVIKYYASKGNMGEVIKVMKDQHIPLTSVLSFFLYLIRRIVTKRAYGFMLKV